KVFSDNTKSWSGDHCMDPRIVPGIFFCNRKINTEAHNILDLAPTVLDLFGIEAPPYMQGGPLFGAPRHPPAPSGAPPSTTPKARTTPARTRRAREPAPAAR